MKIFYKRILSLLIILSMTVNIVAASGIEGLEFNGEANLLEEVLGEDKPEKEGQEEAFEIVEEDPVKLSEETKEEREGDPKISLENEEDKDKEDDESIVKVSEELNGVAVYDEIQRLIGIGKKEIIVEIDGDWEINIIKPLEIKRSNNYGQIDLIFKSKSNLEKATIKYVGDSEKSNSFILSIKDSSVYNSQYVLNITFTDINFEGADDEHSVGIVGPYMGDITLEDVSISNYKMKKESPALFSLNMGDLLVKGEAIYENNEVTGIFNLNEVNVYKYNITMDLESLDLSGNKLIGGGNSSFFKTNGSMIIEAKNSIIMEGNVLKDELKDNGSLISIGKNLKNKEEDSIDSSIKSKCGDIEIKNNNLGDSGLLRSSNKSNSNNPVLSLSAKDELIISGNELKARGVINLENFDIELKASKLLFEKNNTDGSGSVININGSKDKKISIEGEAEFKENTAGENGGAINLNSGSASIDLIGDLSSVSFVGNSAGENGGAISGQGDITLSGRVMDFYKNTANTNGGAIYTKGNLNFEDLTSLNLIGNEADSGAAISANNIGDVIKDDYYNPSVFENLENLLVIYNGDKAVINGTSIIPDMSGKLIIDANGGRFGEDKEKLEYSLGVKPQLSIGELPPLTGPDGGGTDSIDKIIISHGEDPLKGDELKAIDDLNNYLDKYRSINKIIDLDNLSSENIGKIKDVFSNPAIEELLRLREIKATLVWKERAGVTLDANGGTYQDGSSVKTMIIDKGTSLENTRLEKPIRKGYDFAGWLIKLDGQDQDFDFKTLINKDTNLYAKWRENQIVELPIDQGIARVMVRLDANGGGFAGGDTRKTIGMDKGTKLSQASLEIPSRPDYKFAGWRKEGETSNFNFETNINEALTLVAQWIKEATSGGGGGGGGRDRDPRPEPPKVENKPKDPVGPVDRPSSTRDRKDRIIGEILEPRLDFDINMVDHLAYIKGYGDGSIRPNASLTREEAAMVFYRIMDGEFRDSVRTSEHGFTDIEKGRWSEVAIASLANAGLVTGYGDGSFQPKKPISRAEVASLIGKLTDTIVLETEFEDILEHWAEDYINSVQHRGWIQGYSDGSFKPNKLLSRSEFASIMNSVLERKLNRKYILDGIKTFKDLEKDKWYYEVMVEAINGHSYTIEDGIEIWTELDNRDFE